jgi:tetratricopeptide (TPR) repeat protein
MRIAIWRRPELLFLASLIVLGVVLALRSIQTEPLGQVAVDMAAPAPAPVDLGDPRAIAQFQERIRANPDDVDAYAYLGLAMLQRVRETGDQTLYSQADQALAEALRRDPNHLEALIGRGSLALSLHNFSEALRLGEQARDLNPYRAQVYGIIGDALVELGRYEEANAAFQKMVDTRPDLNSYSRVSYIRELYGQTPGAIEAMQLAVEAGAPGSESMLWTMVQLGNLYFNSGDLASADAVYQATLSFRADYPYAQAGTAKVKAAYGRRSDAIAIYEPLVKRLPIPEFVVALGDLYTVTNQPAKARTQYDLVRAMQQLNAQAGMNVDLELALFEADRGADPAKALALAQAAYKIRPGIYGADTLAWAYYKAGNLAEAQRYSKEALRLGTRDAMLHYHAAKIAEAAGDSVAANEHMALVKQINPYFSLLHTEHLKKA